MLLIHFSNNAINVLLLQNASITEQKVVIKLLESGGPAKPENLIVEKTMHPIPTKPSVQKEQWDRKKRWVGGRVGGREGGCVRVYVRLRVCLCVCTITIESPFYSCALTHTHNRVCVCVCVYECVYTCTYICM